MAVMFDSLMRRHEAERQFSLMAGAPRRRSRGTRVGIDGFLPPADAAAEMGVSVEELVDMVRGGLLEYLEGGGGTVYMRPAVVSRLGVRGS